MQKLAQVALTDDFNIEPENAFQAADQDELRVVKEIRSNDDEALSKEIQKIKPGKYSMKLYESIIGRCSKCF